MALGSSAHANLGGGPVKCIPDDGMRDRRKMNANLMRPPGMRLYFDQRGPIHFCQRPPIRPSLSRMAGQAAAANLLGPNGIGTQRAPGLSPVNRHPRAPVQIASNRQFNVSLLFL